MTDPFNNLRQQNNSLEKSGELLGDVSLKDVQELPAVFERVMESQKSFNLIEAKGKLADVRSELSALEAVVADYQRKLAEKVIETGEVSELDRSRGSVLMNRQNALVAEKEKLSKAIKRAKKVQTAVGHLTTAGTMLKSVENTLVPDVANEFKPLIVLPIKNLNEFAAPLKKYGNTTDLAVDLPPMVPDDIPAGEEIITGWQELDEVEIPKEVRELFGKK